MMRVLPLLLLLLLGACAEQGFEERALDVDVPAADGQLRIDVYPPTDLGLRDGAGGLLDLRPQTYFESVEGDSQVELTVTPAVAVGGLVEGIALTPFPSADLPSVAGPLAGARVQFGQEDGVQQPRTVTLDNGIYDVPVVPSGLEYGVTIIPETPYVPILRERVVVDGSTRTIDFFVELGAPVWGQLSDSRGTPLVDTAVHVTTAAGITSAETRTDDTGRYLVAVLPGEAYTVVSTPDNPRDPVLRATTGLVPAEGARVDLERGSDQVGTISGTILAPDGGLIDDEEVVIRIVSTELEGYGESTQGSVVRETSTFRGNFDAVVPSGTYRIEVAPQELEGPSPVALTGVTVRTGQTDLGRLSLAPVPPRFGDVIDELGDPVAGALVTCTEQGFARRSWSATADPAGQFIISVPLTEATCTMTPPADRLDLALTRQAIGDELAMDAELRWTLSMKPGSLVSGVVNARTRASLDAPPREVVPGALVEVRDAAGNLLGIAASDEDGEFSIRVAQ